MTMKKVTEVTVRRDAAPIRRPRSRSPFATDKQTRAAIERFILYNRKLIEDLAR